MSAMISDLERLLQVLKHVRLHNIVIGHLFRYNSLIWREASRGQSGDDAAKTPNTKGIGVDKSDAEVLANFKLNLRPTIVQQVRTAIQLSHAMGL